MPAPKKKVVTTSATAATAPKRKAAPKKAATKKAAPKKTANSKAKPAKGRVKATPKARPGAPRGHREGAEVQNGVVRPRKDGDVKKVWELCDKLNKRKATSPPPRAVVMELGTEAGVNPHTIAKQLTLWRKFNGISGRVKKAA